MATQVYTFLATYEGLEDKIWRRVQVSSNYTLDRLGYAALVMFDTLAYHMFEVVYNGNSYVLPTEDMQKYGADMATVKLSALNMSVGDTLRVEYDYGTTQVFNMKLESVEPMKRGTGNHYPYVLDGAGQGIIDDMASDELAELIAQIDSSGATDEPVYYNERKQPWDYRSFDIELLNMLFKGEISNVEEAYAPFWLGEEYE